MGQQQNVWMFANREREQNIKRNKEIEKNMKNDSKFSKKTFHFNN